MMTLYTPAWFALFDGVFSGVFSAALEGRVAFDWTTVFIACAVALGGWLVLHILQGVGLFAMAKKAGVPHRWRAFVPFANLMLAGKLAGEASFFGRKLKNIGLYAMLLHIFATLLYLAYAVSEVMLFVAYQDKLQIVVSQYGSWYPSWVDLPQIGLVFESIYTICSYVLPLYGLVHSLFVIMLYMSLFKKYSPRHGVGLGILCLVPFAAEITTFVLRNKTPIDYEAYLRARREAYMRNHQHYGNPYGGNPYGRNPYGGNPYGQNPYGGNPYGQNPYGQDPRAGQQAPPEDPFGEFNENGAKGGGQSGGSSSQSDDWFN
ncbi:MAG: hypothetical protein IJX98_05535 [Clostridia bacterium]|nr:hypothetical protein [Clostridia bacterium]